MTPSQPQTARARHFLISGFILLLLLAGSVMWFVQRERADAAGAQTILLAKQQLSDILSTVRQGDSGVRGYLLTDNPIALSAYDLTVAALPDKMRDLHATLRAGVDAADLAAAQSLIVDRLAQLARIVALYKSGDRAGAVALVTVSVNQQTLVHLRDLIGTIQDSLSQRLAAAQGRNIWTGRLLQLATGLAVLGTILLAWFTIRDNRIQTEQLLAAERDAAERSRELDRIFQLSADLLAVIDFSGRFRAVSPAWQQITGWSIEEALRRPYQDFLHPDDVATSLATFAQVQNGVPALDFENRYRRADGGYCWMSWRAVPLLEEQMVYCIARDVTEEKGREEQLRQSQKMEVVGQLTGGIAHDFNNLLTIIMGSLELLQRGLADGEPKLLRRVDNAMEGARRAATLTHRLLAFSRRQPLAPKPLEINRLIAGMSDMLHRTLGESVAVELVSGAGLWPALADGNQLENALLNLAVNARDAMPDGGHLTIETQNTHLDDGYVGSTPEVQPGQYVQISVSDTGTGMAADVRDKVFEPFFTTKPQGQGTGLGLAQVYGFIKQSGGHIAIYSESGQGTTVKLYLPRQRAATAAAAPSEVVSPSAASKGEVTGHGEMILLVEDEAGVRNFAAETLEELGYAVLVAETADAALRIFETTPGIKMLFTDVVLPGTMNGRLLANEILSRAPDTVVLFTTGYTRNAIIHHGRLDDGINFIGKPFTASALATTIRKLLDNAEAERETVS